MPIYEYECLTCGTTFEKRQSYSDEAFADCPNGHDDTRRLLSAPAIVFKGSGFYITDSKTGAKSATAANTTNGSTTSESSTNTNGNGNTETKSETKSETTSESKAKTSTTAD